LHLVLIGAAVIVIGIAGVMMFKGGAAPEAPVATDKVAATPKADEPEQPPKIEKEKEPAKKVEPVVVAPAVEPEMKAPEPAPKVEKKIAVEPVPAPTPTPVPAAMPVIVPVPETPQELMQQLEKRDAELALMITDFAAQWLANTETGTDSEMQSLADKYIPALQRSLTGLVPQQRDFVLSEISHIANHEPLEEPDQLWPEVLKTLRKAYVAQREAIQGRADMAVQKMRAEQCELVLQKARERRAAGKEEAAKRAEVVAAELAKLKTAPSLSALRQNAAGATGAGTAPPTAAEPVR
ncbi:MAG: hypothetical protein IT434_18715, partial [Phycisphaerales bacterium]|nr:hypothetical protein [Phycisphaerales bacterium]